MSRSVFVKFFQIGGFRVSSLESCLNVEKIIRNIGLIYDTEDGLADFVRCFHSTWQAYEAFDSEHTKAIEQVLKHVVFSSSVERVDPEKTGAAVAYRNEDQFCEIRFHSVPFAVGHDRFRENIIAHELRHVWQFATNYEQSAELRLKLQQLIWESDAVRFAKNLIGKESNVPNLADFGLPCDESFDRLVDCWDRLTESERLDVLQLASGLASERRANVIAGNI